MMVWADLRSRPSRVIDPGTGSGRFLMAAGRRFEGAQLIGIESNPVAATIARANLAVAGLADRSEIRVQDYRSANLPSISGQTLFAGNPPYVRHHLIDRDWKKWLLCTAKKYDCSASALAGLHAHFFLATAEFTRAGDVGVFITSAEWLDVNYGRLIRELFLSHLGGSNLQIIEPTALPFPGVAATGVISGFRVGEKPSSICLNRVETLDALGSLDTGRQVRRERLENANRWTPLSRTPVQKREGFVELGELCRVHRGQVTGANQVWIANDNGYLLPRSVLYPSITKARELLELTGSSMTPRLCDALLTSRSIWIFSAPKIEKKSTIICGLRFVAERIWVMSPVIARLGGLSGLGHRHRSLPRTWPEDLRFLSAILQVRVISMSRMACILGKTLIAPR